MNETTELLVETETTPVDNKLNEYKEYARLCITEGQDFLNYSEWLSYWYMDV